MTRRPKVWEPREGTSGGEEMPEWEVAWMLPPTENMPIRYGFSIGYYGFSIGYRVRAHHAWDAWLQVPGAPAFGSCRVRRVE